MPDSAAWATPGQNQASALGGRRTWPRLRLPFRRLQRPLNRLARTLAQVVYGMTVYGMVRDLQRERGDMERLFVVLTFGDLLGVPILPTYHKLRLLPYVLPRIEGWRRSVLRERDLDDLCPQEIA